MNRPHPASPPSDRPRGSVWPTVERIAVLGLLGFAMYVWTL